VISETFSNHLEFNQSLISCHFKDDESQNPQKSDDFLGRSSLDAKEAEIKIIVRMPIIEPITENVKYATQKRYKYYGDWNREAGNKNKIDFEAGSQVQDSKIT
jgi:hypothetical protein|tara:strand:- start:577 stop:885 length:309 start_codon:yes stop_codon:yes gene_type:complete